MVGQPLAHDLTAMRAKVGHDLYRVRDKVLQALERMLDRNPDKVTFANLSIAYGILTDKQLLMEQGPVTTTNNTIVINGLSRAQALGYLRDDAGMNGFLHSRALPEPDNNSNVMEIPATVQNTPVLVDSQPSLQR